MGVTGEGGREEEGEGKEGSNKRGKGDREGRRGHGREVVRKTRKGNYVKRVQRRK